MDISGTRPEIANRLKKYAESKRHKDGTALSAAFVKNGELVAAFACGTQDGKSKNPATVDDLFAVGSVSKLYCAMAVMKLVEMGKVSLDTPVTVYLPRFTMKDERYKKITLHMCLNHSSGLPGTNLKYSFNTKWLGESLCADFYDYFAKSKLKDDPGNASVYCNDGYMLAEKVVAEVSGMRFIDFVRVHIAASADALSTCSGGDIPQGAVRIRAKGQPAEYLMNTAAGGILTNLPDCARVGYLLIDPKDLFKPESIHEMAKPQGKSFLATPINNFGLGLDFVDFSLFPYDFGENTLAKGGGTAAFGAFLLVSQKYKLSAAIALTNDNRLPSYSVLCELCAMLLAEYGIDARKASETKADEAEKKPLPAGLAQKLSGMYYSCMAAYRVSFDGDLLQIQVRQAKAWRDMVSDAFFDGRRFIADNRKFVFEEYKDNVYLIEEEATIWGKNLWGQKCPAFLPIGGAWKERVGKKYIVCDAHPADAALTTGGFAMTIQEFEGEEGLLFFAYKGSFSQNTLPVIPAGDDETAMVLNTPLMGSRENFAPFVYEKDGAEYLYAFGYNLMDTADIKPLQTGRVASESGRQNKLFRVTAGSKIKMDIPNDVRVMLFDADLQQVYDSASGRKIGKACDGHILFANEGAMDIWVEVRNR